MGPGSRVMSEIRTHTVKEDTEEGGGGAVQP